MVKTIIQFGYNVKVPQGIPLVDCRVIPNPYNISSEVEQRHMVRSHPKFELLVEEALALLEKHDVIGVGCGYGVHRSACVVNAIESRCIHHIKVEKIGKRA